MDDVRHRRGHLRPPPLSAAGAASAAVQSTKLSSAVCECVTFTQQHRLRNCAYRRVCWDKALHKRIAQGSWYSVTSDRVCPRASGCQTAHVLSASDVEANQCTSAATNI